MRGTCGPTSTHDLSRTYSLVLCSMLEMLSSLTGEWRQPGTCKDMLGGEAGGVLVNIQLCLAIAAVVIAILTRTSAVQVPSLERVAPKYFKLITSSSFSSFVVMSELVFFMLVIMIFDCSVLTFIPFAPSVINVSGVVY
ncbi:hypothetical protein DPMN_084464 [Dreissena polymorpha]|uniref:Uncharacterized protein n=1 Tax=Dreissena polymorpha TaxID=45954 RepID=A0A9D3YB24_DREPO|nr:hypothetical protein DPMN_084464 [Dreissena polymorpha]